MTLELLRQKPIGVLECRKITINAKGLEDTSHYFLIKGKNNKYFIGFSEDASYCCRGITEKDMLELLNDEDLSFIEAMDIYMQSPHLSCWITE